MNRITRWMLNVILAWVLMAEGLSTAIPTPRVSQGELPFPDLTYTIIVHLDPRTRELRGNQILRWVNRGQHAISQVPLHLYLNAFSHTGTTWMREIRESFPERFVMDRLLAQYPDPWGALAPTSICQHLSPGSEKKGNEPEIAERTNNQTKEATWKAIQPDDGNSLDQTLIQVELPEPVPAGGVLVLSLAFRGRLPIPISRTGCVEDFCLVGQWFPKIAVLEIAGERHAPTDRWAARQFHGTTEFYADFADYDVTIETPVGWLVGATGQEITEAPKTKGEWQTVRYVQRAVHDFAFVVGKHLDEERAVYKPQGSDKPVNLRLIFPRGTEHQIPRLRHALEGAFDLMTNRIGPYPYHTLTAVFPPYRARRIAGMEYPTFIVAGTGESLWDGPPFLGIRPREGTLIHEFGHQYFYGLLANNEQMEAFLDEGFTTYWEGRCFEALYGRPASGGVIFGRPVDVTQVYAYDLNQYKKLLREPLRKRPSWLFYPGTQFQQIYPRGGLTLWTATELFGESVVDRVFSEYFRRYGFQHPDTDDFLSVAAQAGGQGIASFLREAFEQGSLPDYQVVFASSHPYRPPQGKLLAAMKGGSWETPLSWLARESGLEKGEKVWLEITDPGWVRQDKSVDGTVMWRAFPRSIGSAVHAGATHQEYFESRVLVEGPAWDHLPVEVLLQFEDGVVIRELWDGKSSWRGYRALRPAPLREVRLDPQAKLAIDVVPQNNSLAVKANSRFVADWGSWLGALAQWLAAGVATWL